MYNDKAYNVRTVAQRTLTVADLREQLANLDGDMPVVISYNWGDHGRGTECVQVIKSVADGIALADTGYSPTDLCVPGDHDDPDYCEECDNALTGDGDCTNTACPAYDAAALAAAAAAAEAEQKFVVLRGY